MCESCGCGRGSPRLQVLAWMTGWQAGKLSACRAHEGRTTPTLREHSDPWRLPWQLPSKWMWWLQLPSTLISDVLTGKHVRLSGGVPSTTVLQHTDGSEMDKI